MLTVDDLYLNRSSYKVFTFFHELQGRKNLNVFSIDIKDLYYALPQDRLLQCVEENIDTYSTIAFQNASGISQREFLNLIDLYLKSIRHLG